MITIFSRKGTISLLFCQLAHVETVFLPIYLLWQPLLIIYCVDQLLLHNKVAPTLVAQNNNKHLLWLTVSVDLGRAKLGASGLGSHGIAVMTLGLQSSKDVTGAGEWDSQWFPNMADRSVTVACGKPPFLSTRSFPWGCWSVLTTWWLTSLTQSERSRERAKRQLSFFLMSLLPHPNHWLFGDLLSLAQIQRG